LVSARIAAGAAGLLAVALVAAWRWLPPLFLPLEFCAWTR
jgi:hypothetical protein